MFGLVSRLHGSVFSIFRAFGCRVSVVSSLIYMFVDVLPIDLVIFTVLLLNSCFSEMMPHNTKAKYM